MENKRQFKPLAIIHNDTIKSLRSYIELSNLYYEINKKLLDNKEHKEQWISYLQDECRELKAKINNTIEHYQYNKSAITEIEKAKEKCKDCNLLLNKYKLELINLGAEIQNKEIENAFDFDLSNDNQIKKKLLPNYLEIQKEFLDFMNFDKTLSTEIYESENEHSDIFAKNGFKLFSYILENHIQPIGKRGRYSDLSYYYWKMFNEEPKYIHQRPEPFKRWFCNFYSDNFEKIKTENEVTDIKGNKFKNYQTSLDWFKQQKNIKSKKVQF